MVSEVVALARAAVGRVVDLAVFGFAAMVAVSYTHLTLPTILLV